LKEDWKHYLVEMEEEKARQIRSNQQYRADLDAQSAYNVLLKVNSLLQYECIPLVGNLHLWMGTFGFITTFFFIGTGVGGIGAAEQTG